MSLHRLSALCLLALAFCASCKKDDDSTGTNPPPPPPVSDTFTLQVQQGYGSGRYKAGDTVHVFAQNLSTTQLFDQWTGDASLLNAPHEWHTWFIMPKRNVSLTATLKTIPALNLHYEMIRGRDNPKPVFYFFPPSPKGIVYLLHGTGGMAAIVAGDYEWQLLSRLLVNAGYAVVITEAEESTLHSDLNGDGKIRWALLPADTLTNVDYANIRIITDTFFQRNDAPRGTPQFAIGMSNGGFFASALAYMYHFKACVSYCAQGPSTIQQVTTVPTQFCMARNDDNDQVGPQGNLDAYSFSNNLQTRGICSRYLVKERSPLYPQRFARDGSISDALSQQIFDEIKANGLLDAKNYFLGTKDAFVNAYQSNSSAFPVINGLSLAQQTFVSSQVNLAVSGHRMYSDYNYATLEFLEGICP